MQILSKTALILLNLTKLGWAICLAQACRCSFAVLCSCRRYRLTTTVFYNTKNRLLSMLKKTIIASTSIILWLLQQRNDFRDPEKQHDADGIGKHII